jgi:phosphoserine phosphatase
MAMTTPDETDDRVPLCVDLDGTLIATDLLWVSLRHVLLRAPWLALAAPFWWRRGRGFLKAELARRAQLDFTRLPYRGDVLAFLREARARGRRLVLVTGSHERYARELAAMLGLFEDVLATTAELNVTGRRKAVLLVERYGRRGFDYIGNSRADLPVWAAARRALVAHAPAWVRVRARALGNVEREW